MESACDRSVACGVFPASQRSDCVFAGYRSCCGKNDFCDEPVRSPEAVGDCLRALPSTDCSVFQQPALPPVCFGVAAPVPRGGGIGDDCKGYFYCESEICARSYEARHVVGWCTKPCSTDRECAGSQDGGLNAAGQSNYCVRSAAGVGSCFTGCPTGTECRRFTGATCGAVSTLNVCSLEP